MKNKKGLIIYFIFIFIASFIISFSIFNNQKKTSYQEPTSIVEVVGEPLKIEITSAETFNKPETKTKIVIKEQKKLVTKTNNAAALKTFTGFITHYGPDCKGCGGTTAAGYNVKNTIYYNDKTYGIVRIVAMDRSYPLYSIIRISNYKQGAITAIVLDRGGAIKGNKIDLLVSSEKESSKLGIQRNAQVKVLRWGK